MMECQRSPSSPRDRSIDAIAATPIARPALSRRMINIFHIILSRGVTGMCAACRGGRLQRGMTNLQTLSRSRSFDAFGAFFLDSVTTSSSPRARGRGSDLALLIWRSRYRRADSTPPSRRLAVHRNPQTQGVGSPSIVSAGLARSFAARQRWSAHASSKPAMHDSFSVG